MNEDFLKGYIHGLEVALNLDADGIENLIEIAKKELELPTPTNKEHD